jgi:hypothetical protein
MATVVINSNTPVFTRSLERVSFPGVEVSESVRVVNINSILPFRIRFTSIQVPTSLGNVPAIPLQIIGYSNYIL